MVAVDKIRNDIERTKTKVVEQQKRLCELEQEVAKEENLETVRMVKTVKLDSKEPSALLKAHANGRISLPEDVQAGLKEQEGSENKE